MNGCAGITNEKDVLTFKLQVIKLLQSVLDDSKLTDYSKSEEVIKELKRLIKHYKEIKGHLESL